MSGACEEGVAVGKLGKAGPNQTSANRWNTGLSTTPKRGRNSPYRDKDWLGPPRALAHRWSRWHCPVGGGLKVAPRLHWICSHDLAGAEGEELLADRTCWGKYMSSLELVKEVLEAARNSEFSGDGSTMKAKHWLSVMM